MEDVLIVLVQGLLELVLEVLSWMIMASWPFPDRDPPEEPNIWWRCFKWTLVGAALGWVSTLVFKHTFLSLAALRVANLVIAPLASAYLAYTVAVRRSEFHTAIRPSDNFWQAFWFTLALVAVRMAYVART